MGTGNYKTLIILFCCWLASCKKDKPDGPKTIPNANGSVYVVCEGNFGTGDASLYLYNPVHDSVFGDLYKSVNNQDLGDVLESIQHIGDKLFLCVNNSDKVVVLNATNWQLVTTITIPKPRYILPVSADKVYVTSEYSNKVYTVNPQTLEVTGSITLPNLNTEGMCLYYNYAFVCTWDTGCNKIYKVDVTTGAVAQTIPVAGYAPQEAVLDKEQMLWVMAGEQHEGFTATLTRIDPSTGVTLASYVFPKEANALKPVFNVTKDTLYFIEANQDGGAACNGIYRMGIHETTLPATAFVPAKQFQYFWALGVDPATNNIYVGDPRGFIQKGIVYVYRPDGSQVTSFNVGLGPGHFYFDY